MRYSFRGARTADATARLTNAAVEIISCWAARVATNLVML
jgi:hypothetical protein